MLAVFRGEVSRPVFLFSRAVVRDFYDVVIFRQKNQQGIFRYISRFQPQKSRLFQINRVLNWIEETGVYFSNCYPEETGNGVACLSQIAVGNSRKACPIRPFPRSNTPAKVLKPLFRETKTGLPYEEMASSSKTIASLVGCLCHTAGPVICRYEK